MAKEREKEAREIPKSIFLSKLQIQDFGVISNETLHFDQGVNELIELPENGNVGTYVLKAIEILLWPARSESEPRAFRDEALQASWGETTSYIMGTFESRRIYGKVDRSDHVRHSISVAIGGRIGKHAVYAWHEIPHDGPDVTGFFEKHGWHSASAIYLSKNMLIGGCRLPMEFFSGQLHKLDYLKEYRTSVDLLDSETVPFTDANELKESNKCRLDKAKFQAGTLGMEEFRRSLEPLLYYSTLKKLRDSANKFKLTITKKESELHAQERSQRRRLTTRRKEMITKLGFVESASPPKLSRLSKLCNATLRDTRRRLKEEHKKKTNALRILAAAENVDDRIDRHDSLKEAIEKNLSELLDKRTLLTKVETERQQKASRLKLVKDHVVPLGTSGRFSEGIRSKINFLEERASTVGGEKSSAEAAIKKLEERRAGIVAERLQVEERLRKREEDLTKLIRQELMAQKAVNEAREDRERESGNAAKLERFTPQEEHEPRGNEDSPADRSRLSRESTQVLMMMNSSIRAKFNSNDGFFGAVFDHIDVKEEHHCLLRTIESFLATFLVRDREVATILREHIQLEKIESTVTLISFDDFNRLPEKYPIPNKTTPLSTYLKVKDTGPHKLPSLPLVNKLTDIIGWELRKHVVIEGNPEESSAAASKFLEDPEWESFTFIARDGTCFTNNARNEPATDGSVLKAYDKIRGYWESKQLELTSRLEEYRLCNHQRTEVNAEVLSILEETRKNLQEIDQVQRDLHWHHSAWNRLDRESRIIQRELDKLKKQHIATRSTDSDRLERSITSLDNTIEQLKNEIRVLDDASSSLIMQMAENLIAVASRNEKYKRRDILQSEIDVFKAQFEETENFIHDYEELEYEEVDDTTLAVDEDASRYEAETPLYQTRIFLLRQKLAEAQGKVGELEVKGREAGFDPNVDPARKLREMIRTQNMNLPPVSEQSRQRLLDNLGRAGQVDDVPEFSESRISRIPTLLNVADFVPTEQESLRNTLLCFKRVLEELGVSQGIMISEEHELPSGEVARRLRPPHDNRPFDEKRAFVELDFGPAAASPKRPKWTHNNEPLILALVARAMLHIPRFLLVDDQDVSLASLWDPVQERFFSEFRDTCQIIILSHDQSEERPYEFDKRIQL